jgi:hypothetical protein
MATRLRRHAVRLVDGAVHVIAWAASIFFAEGHRFHPLVITHILQTHRCHHRGLHHRSALLSGTLVDHDLSVALSAGV